MSPEEFLSWERVSVTCHLLVTKDDQISDPILS